MAHACNVRSAAAWRHLWVRSPPFLLATPLLPAQAPAGGRSGVMAPPARGAPDPEQLKEAEASVMRLEKELGTSHPEVGCVGGEIPLLLLLNR